MREKPEAAKFTPGPWRAEYDDNGFYHIQGERFISPYIAATGGEGDLNEANARLIAEAPAMYEALKEAMECIRIFHGPVAWEIYRDKSPEMQRFNTILARIEGK